ncbi:MAG: extracellular solute-binding protein [Firmicutes bacterium]|nr:extracellular solute-binding protein [Bacillota bacterium]
MKRFLKTAASAALAALTAITVLAACSGTSNSPSGNNAAPSAAPSAAPPSAAADNSGPPLFKKYDPPITITTARWVNGDLDSKYRSGDSWDNNVWTRHLQDTYGIIFKDDWTAPGWGDFEQKLSLNLAAGEAMPDVIFDFYNPGNATLAKIMENYDLLMPMSANYDKYASDFVKQSQAPVLKSLRAPFTVNGELYALPNANDGMGNENCMYYRKDWLDAAGVGIPQTMDDLDKVLAALKAADSSRTPIAFGWKDNLVTYLAETSWVFGAYGAIPTIWMKDSSGKLVYGSIQPQIKDGLAKLREWYANGYIDSQAAMNNVWDATGKDFAGEKSGVISGPSWLYSQISGSLLVNNPNAVVVPGPTPSGPSGKAMELGYNPLANAFFFSKDFKNIEAFFDYYNSIFEAQNPNSAYPIYQYGYVQGMDYNLDASGNPVYGDDMKTVDPLGYYDGWDGLMVGYNSFSTVPFAKYEIYTKLASGAAPVSPAEKRLAADSDLVKSASAMIYSQKGIGLVDAYYGPAPSNATVWDNLQKMEFNTFLQIIYGQAPLDDFDTFVTNWKAQGGDDVTKEFNDWYAANAK